MEGESTAIEIILDDISVENAGVYEATANMSGNIELNSSIILTVRGLLVIRQK